MPVELFQILKDDAVKVLHSICQHIWKLGGDPASPQKLFPELMLQIGGCQIYVTGSIQEKTLDTVMRVIRNA